MAFSYRVLHSPLFQQSQNLVSDTFCLHNYLSEQIVMLFRILKSGSFL
jgi:hypothetical protein